jgi:hypothetical protein
MAAAVPLAADWRFQLFGLAFMATVAVVPQFVIYVSSFGRVRQLSKTGVMALRLIGGISALSFLYDLMSHFIG